MIGMNIRLIVSNSMRNYVQVRSMGDTKEKKQKLNKSQNLARLKPAIQSLVFPEGKLIRSLFRHGPSHMIWTDGRVNSYQTY